MKKLVSILILLVLLVIGLWGGTTYWFGIKAEQQYLALLQQASQWQQLKFVNESYSSRFLSVASPFGHRNSTAAGNERGFPTLQDHPGSRDHPRPLPSRTHSPTDRGG